MATITANKSSTLLRSTTTNLAGATYTSSGYSTEVEAGFHFRIANGATAPATPCDFHVEVSHDDVTYHPHATYYGPVGPSSGPDGVAEQSVELPRWAPYARGVFAGNDTQDVTIMLRAFRVDSYTAA